MAGKFKLKGWGVNFKEGKESASSRVGIRVEVKWQVNLIFSPKSIVDSGSSIILPKEVSSQESRGGDSSSIQEEERVIIKSSGGLGLKVNAG